MAVTTLASMEAGFLPIDVGPGPFPDNGIDYWWDIRKGLIALKETCVNNRKGGIRWYRKFRLLFPAPLGFCRP